MLKMEPIQSPRKAGMMTSMPNYEYKKFDKNMMNEIKQSNIMASTENFDSNRSMHKSPNPKGSLAFS